MSAWLARLALIVVALLSVANMAAAATAAASASADTSPRTLKSFHSFAPPLPTGARPSADPRDFEGVYNINPIAQLIEPAEGGERSAEGLSIPPFSDAGAKIFWHRIERYNAGRQIPEPSVMCEPSWKTRTSSLMQFVQTKDLLAIFSAEQHIVRLIHMQARHPRQVQPSYMGHSIGHWQGSTLVVDTIGFNSRGWFDFAGTPQSPTLHLVERFTKQANGDLRDAMTFADPALFRHSFTTVEMYRRVGPEWETLDEQICEENERNFEREARQ